MQYDKSDAQIDTQKQALKIGTDVKKEKKATSIVHCIEGIYSLKKNNSGFSVIVCHQLKYRVEFQPRVSDSSFD